MQLMDIIMQYLAHCKVLITVLEYMELQEIIHLEST